MTTHPEYEYTALVRSEAKAKEARKFLPTYTRFVIGDFDSFDQIASEAAAADIVLNWGSSDHDGLNNAILTGLKTKQTNGFLIHTSGTALLAYDDAKDNRQGVESSTVYDDWEGVGEVVALPDDATHMNVDRAIMNAASAHPQVRTAIVCPPLIHGISNNKYGPLARSGPGQYVVQILNHGKGFYVGEGKSRWNTVHINDLAHLFLLLVEQAVRGGEEASWGPDSYYFAESGDVMWAEFAAEVSRIAFDKGLIGTREVESLTAEQGYQQGLSSTYLALQNSRSRAVRARKLLDWKPVALGLMEDIEKNWRFSADDVNPFI